MSSPIQIAARQDSYQVLAKEFGSGELSAGKKVVTLDHLPTEEFGRVAHLLTLWIRIVFQFDVDAATLAAAVDREMITRQLQDIRLKVEGHSFIDGLDGEELMRLMETRLGQGLARPSDIADANATDTQVEIFFPIYCGRPAARSVARRKDGIIPLRVFGRDSNQLSFTIAADPGITGLTWDGVQAMEVWADIGFEDKFRKPTPWQCRKIQTSQPFVDFNSAGGIETLMSVSRTSGAYASGDQDYTGVKLRVGGRLLYEGRTTKQVADAYNLKRLASGQVSAAIVDTDAPETLPFIAPTDPDYNRSQLPRGRVRLEFTDVTGYTTKSFLVSETGVHTDDWEQRFIAAAGANPNATTVRPLTAGSPLDSEHAMAAMLDEAIYWPGMPYRVPARKA